MGQALVARSVKGVCAVLLGDDRDQLKTDLAKRFPELDFAPNDAAVHDDLAKLIRFVDKPSQGLHLRLDMRGTLLQRRVWEKLRAIPAGKNRDIYRGRVLGRATHVGPHGRWRLRS